MIPLKYTNRKYVYRDEVFYRSVESESVLVRLKKHCRLSLDDYWAGCRHFSDKQLPRDMDASQSSDTEDILQQAAIMQGKEKGSPLVNLSLTIVMPSAHYSTLSDFISLSNFHPYVYWCVPLEFCSMKLMEVGVRGHVNVMIMCLSISGGPKNPRVNIAGLLERWVG